MYGVSARAGRATGARKRAGRRDAHDSLCLEAHAERDGDVHARVALLLRGVDLAQAGCEVTVLVDKGAELVAAVLELAQVGSGLCEWVHCRRRAAEVPYAVLLLDAGAGAEPERRERRDDPGLRRPRTCRPSRRSARLLVHERLCSACTGAHLHQLERHHLRPPSSARVANRRAPARPLISPRVDRPPLSHRNPTSRPRDRTRPRTFITRPSSR